MSHKGGMVESESENIIMVYLNPRRLKESKQMWLDAIESESAMVYNKRSFEVRRTIINIL